jgi:hypothetical protein
MGLTLRKNKTTPLTFKEMDDNLEYLAENSKETTYSDLLNLYNAETLKPYTWYIITDFETIDDIPDFELVGGNVVPKDPSDIVTNSSQYSVPTEKIAVYAISNSQFLNQAVSLDFPTCEIWYDINYDETSVTGTPAKGRITRRNCTTNNIDLEFDFRGFTKAWRYDRNGNNNYVHYYDSGTDNRQLVDIADWSQAFNLKISGFDALKSFFGIPFSTPNIRLRGFVLGSNFIGFNFDVGDIIQNSGTINNSNVGDIINNSGTIDNSNVRDINTNSGNITDSNVGDVDTNSGAIVNSNVRDINTNSGVISNSDIGDITLNSAVFQQVNGNDFTIIEIPAITQCDFNADVRDIYGGRLGNTDFTTGATIIYQNGSKQILEQPNGSLKIQTIDNKGTIQINDITD